MKVQVETTHEGISVPESTHEAIPVPESTFAEIWVKEPSAGTALPEPSPSRRREGRGRLKRMLPMLVAVSVFLVFAVLLGLLSFHPIAGGR